jgi:hypothetical protein
MENKNADMAADLTTAICMSLESLSRAVNQQLLFIDRLTTPQPSPFDQVLPAVLPLIVGKLGALLDRARPRDQHDVGPAERKVLVDFEQAHAELVRALESKRAAARLADEMACATPSAPAPTNGTAH